MKRLAKCSTTDCWQAAAGRSGMCKACQSWWRRIRYKSATELTFYVARMRRTAGRIGGLHTAQRRAS